MKILAVNAGSSSLKVQLLEMPNETLIAKAQVERIGLENAIVTVKYNYVNDKNDTWEIRNAVIKNHPDAVKAIMDKFTEFKIIEKVDDIKGVGHRIVQGGEYYSKAEVVTKDVEEKVLELIKKVYNEIPQSKVKTEIPIVLEPNEVNKKEGKRAAEASLSLIHFRVFAKNPPLQFGVRCVPCRHLWL